MVGYIQIHRQILEWGWYQDHVMFKLFLHCLLKANHTPKEWMGIKIKRGQFITSLSKLSEETGLSMKQVRNGLDKLQKSGELGKQSTNQNTLITVVKYNDYQFKDKPRADERQTEGKPRATTNNDKNKEELKEEFKGSSVFFETQMKRHGINDKEVFDIYVGSFIEMVDLKKHNIESLRNYFINWLRGQVDNSKNKKGNTKSGITL